MIDVGNGMKASDKVLAQNAAKVVLSTLSGDDFFTVVKVDSEPKIMTSASKFDKCVSEQLISATPENVARMKKW